MGGAQLLEWAIEKPSVFQELSLIATSARESPWAIAFHSAQRMAIENDATFGLPFADAGKEGLKTARAIGIPTYRSFESFYNKQLDENSVTHHHKVSSYLKYQGKKLAERFNAYSYYALLEVLDTHHVGRSRGSIPKALGLIKAKTTVIGISSDILYPVSEQRILAQLIPNTTYQEISSEYGHDGFLTESEKISSFIHL